MSKAKGGGPALAPTDTIQSFLVTPEISRVAASFPFWWLWSAQSKRDEGRGGHFSCCKFY